MRRNPMNTLLTPDQDTVHADTVHAIIQTLGRGIWSSTTTPAGLLVTLSGRDSATEVVDVLRAAGYTADEVQPGTVLVGGYDSIALMVDQYVELIEQRYRLAQALEVMDRSAV